MANTRRRLIDAALELFALSGFEQTTVEEIAAAAGVSTSTLFRYFPTKESLLFVGEYDYTTILRDAVARQPSARSDIDAVIGSMVELAPMMAAVRERVRLFYDVVASSTLLLGRDRAHHLENVDLLSNTIAARRGQPADAASRLVADVAYTVLTRAHAEWLSEQADVDLADVIRAHFRMVTAAIRESVIV